MNSKHLTTGARPPLSVSRGKTRLYSNRFCPYSHRVLLVLEAKNVPYDVTNVNLVKKPDWIYEKSPSGRIPALELDSGDVIYESLIICDFLDEKYPQNRLHAKDPLQRAKDQLLLGEFAKIISALVKSVQLGRIESEEARVIAEGLSTFEEELTYHRRGPFFGGFGGNNKPGMLDFMIWPWCERFDALKIYGMDHVIKMERYKKLMEWRKVMKLDRTVRRSAIPIEDHVKYLQSCKGGHPEYDLLFN